MDIAKVFNVPVEELFIFNEKKDKIKLEQELNRDKKQRTTL